MNYGIMRAKALAWLLWAFVFPPDSLWLFLLSPPSPRLKPVKMKNKQIQLTGKRSSPPAADSHLSVACSFFHFTLRWTDFDVTWWLFFPPTLHARWAVSSLMTPWLPAVHKTCFTYDTKYSFLDQRECGFGAELSMFARCESVLMEI